MIVKMKKITLLVCAKHTNQALQALRRLGLLHIKHLREPVADEITSLEHRLNALERALTLLKGSSAKAGDFEREMADEYIKEAIELGRKKQEFLVREEELKAKSLAFKEWRGNLPSSLRGLREEGIFIRLYQVSRSALKRIPQDKQVYVVNRRGAGGKVYLALVSRDEGEKLDFPEIELPREDFNSLQRKIREIGYALRQIDRRLGCLCAYKGHLTLYRNEILKKIEFYKVRSGMAQDEGIACLRGFCPKEAAAAISKAAENEGWAVISEEPDNPEDVPTLIRNPKWIEIVRPVFNFMRTLPGYKEHDISFPFLVFFSIFFALLIGDAGYGLFFLAATFLARKKSKNANQQVFSLLYLLSSVTVIWGTVTGTWFGFEKIAQLPFLNYLVIERINSFISANQIFMIYLSFFIGAVHLSLAHAIIAFRSSNSLFALAQIGWVSVIWALFFIAGKIILNRPFPDSTPFLGIGGALLIILFSHPAKNIFKGALISLADLPLKVISSFSDLVSYLRLFAVGYATVAVATAFNNMALRAGFSSILAGFIAALILFFGHLLNMILGIIAVIVHGLRLNMLEFSGHLEMQWSGKEYRPFKE